MNENKYTTFEMTCKDMFGELFVRHRDQHRYDTIEEIENWTNRVRHQWWYFVGLYMKDHHTADIRPLLDQVTQHIRKSYAAFCPQCLDYIISAFPYEEKVNHSMWADTIKRVVPYVSFNTSELERAFHEQSAAQTGRLQFRGQSLSLVQSGKHYLKPDIADVKNHQDILGDHHSLSLYSWTEGDSLYVTNLTCGPKPPWNPIAFGWNADFDGDEEYRPTRRFVKTKKKKLRNNKK